MPTAGATSPYAAPGAGRSPARRTASVASPSLDLADRLTLVILFAAPLVAGRFEAIPAHAMSGLICLAALLALMRPLPAPLALPRLLILGVSSLAASATLSVFISVARGPSIVALTNWLGWLLLFLLAARLGRTTTGRRAAVLTIGASVAIVGVLALSEYLRMSRELAGGSIWRTFGPFAGPNLLAAFLAMTLPLLLAAALAAERRGLAITLGALVVLELAVLPLTGSRGGLAALAGGLLALTLAALLRREWPDRSALLRLFAILAVGMPLFILLSGPIAGRLVPSGSPPSAAAALAGSTEQAHSNQFRRLTWISTAHMARENLLLGTGIGTFKYVHPRYAIAGFTEMAHQSYLQVTAESGIFGLAGLLMVLLSATFTVPRAPRATGAERWLAAGLGGGIAAAAIHNLIDYSWYLYGTAGLFWGIMGLLAALGGPAPPPPWVGGERVGSRGGRLIAIILVISLLGANLLLETSAARKAAGDTAREQRQGTEALAAYDAAAALFPLDPAPRLVLGDLRLAMGDRERAVEEYRAAVRLAPTRSVHYFRLGRALAQLGRTEEALQAFRTGLDWDPNSIELLTEIAAVQTARGDRQGALESYRRVVAIWEGPVGQVAALAELKDYRPAIALTRLGEAAEAAGRGEEACHLFERAARHLRDRRRGMAWMAKVLQEIDRVRPEEEAQRRREEARLWERVARCAQDSGRAEQAEEARRFAAEAREATDP
jgi:tetratricopeptide (TPR) repeat protein/O-antigen ligase